MTLVDPAVPVITNQAEAAAAVAAWIADPDTDPALISAFVEAARLRRLACLPVRTLPPTRPDRNTITTGSPETPCSGR